MLFIPCLTILVLALGCEAGHDKALDGDLFDRKAGTLGRTTAVFDSTVGFGGVFTSSSNVLAGTYGRISAFALFRYVKPTATVVNNLNKVRMTFYVGGSWSEGNQEYGLYTTSNDWTDSTRIDSSAFLSGLGSPVATWSDTAASISSITFELNNTILNTVKNWPSEGGSFLVKATPTGNGIVNLYSAYSTSTPLIEFISTISGVSDTTRAHASVSNYFFDTGLDGYKKNRRKGILSDGYAGGFVYHLSLPDSFPRTNMINSGKLVIPLELNEIPSNVTANVEVIMLTGAFTTLASASTSSTYRKDYAITSITTNLTVDISEILGIWTMAPASDYGILFKLSNVNSSPAQVVLAPPDSLEILYTAIPEVK